MKYRYIGPVFHCICFGSHLYGSLQSLYCHMKISTASSPVVPGEFCRDVTRKACWENSPGTAFVLSRSVPGLHLTRIARIGLGTRLRFVYFGPQVFHTTGFHQRISTGIRHKHKHMKKETLSFFLCLCHICVK